MSPRWVSALAEEIASLAERVDTYGIGEAVRREARAHGLTEWQVTEMVSRESDRLGIVRGAKRAMVIGR